MRILGRVALTSIFWVACYHAEDSTASMADTETVTSSDTDDIPDTEDIHDTETDTRTGIDSDTDEIPDSENDTDMENGWIKHLVGEMFHAAEVFAADMDGDGDFDIVGAACFHTSELIWWENVNGLGSVWNPHIVDENAHQAREIHVVDMDGDNDLDILCTDYGEPPITWWENDHPSGNGTSWTEHGVEGDSFGIHGADMDGDGDVDLLGSVPSTNHRVIMWENTSDPGNADSWIEHVLLKISAPHVAIGADMDGDGDLDILHGVSHYDSIQWLENAAPSGDASTWTSHTVAGFLDYVKTLRAVDMDGDGDLDVLSAETLGTTIRWFENASPSGDGLTWTEHMVEPNFDGTQSVFAADIDGDGDMDVVGASGYIDEFAWWENKGDSSWTKHILDDTIDLASSVYCADIDGDGDMDIVGATSFTGQFIWWENRLSP